MRISGLFAKEQGALRRLEEARNDLIGSFTMPNFDSANTEAYRDMALAHLHLAAGCAAAGNYRKTVHYIHSAQLYGGLIGIIVPPRLSNLLLTVATDYQKNERITDKNIEEVIEQVIAEEMRRTAASFLDDAERISKKLISEQMASADSIRTKGNYLTGIAMHTKKAATYLRLAGSPITEGQADVFYRALNHYLIGILDYVRSAEAAPSSPMAHPRHSWQVSKKLAEAISKETADGKGGSLEISGKLCERIYTLSSFIINEAVIRAEEQAAVGGVSSARGFFEYATDLACFFGVRSVRITSLEKGLYNR